MQLNKALSLICLLNIKEIQVEESDDVLQTEPVSQDIVNDRKGS